MSWRVAPAYFQVVSVADRRASYGYGRGQTATVANIAPTYGRIYAVVWRTCDIAKVLGKLCNRTRNPHTVHRRANDAASVAGAFSTWIQVGNGWRL